MTDWLKRARLIFSQTPPRGTANTAKTSISAVTTVPHLGTSGKNDGSFLDENTTPKQVPKVPEVAFDTFGTPGTLVYRGNNPELINEAEVSQIVEVWRRLFGFSESRERIATSLQNIRRWQAQGAKR